MLRNFWIVLIIIWTISCDKSEDLNGDSEKGGVLFCTNAHMMNCIFSIDITIDGKKIGLLDASSTYPVADCNCENSSGIGFFIEMDIEDYSFSAMDTKCQATNVTKSWTGDFTVLKDSCTMIFLDITKNKLFSLDTPDLIAQKEYDLICQVFDSIIVQQATDFWITSYSTIKQSINDLDSNAYLNYVDNNKLSYNLDSSMILKTNMKLISLEERDYLINNPEFNYSWEPFFDKYPDSQGLWTISRIGFNSDSTEAMLSYGFSKPFYGMDIINYYKLMDNKWQQTGSIGIQTQ